ncbi:MAG: ABC transporter permease [Rhodobacteraceae bacterium]|nr:ABC transporter permease [Paracoccaceae bacterium]
MRARRYATFRTVAALILREMSTRYGKTPGGYIWAVLEPLGAILILAFGFSLLLRSPSLGTSFILFYASGYLPFNLYQQVSLVVARAINFSRALLYYPSVTWVDAILARFVLNTLTGMMVTYILLFAILGLTDTRVVLDVVPIIAALVLAAFLGLGIGTLNCLLGGLFPTWDIIWSIASRPLFLASGILFTYEDLPNSVQSVLYYNPLIHITGLMRSGLYPMYNPQYVSPVYVIAISTVTLGFGVLLLARHHKTILNS